MKVASFKSPVVPSFVPAVVISWGRPPRLISPNESVLAKPLTLPPLFALYFEPGATSTFRLTWARGAPGGSPTFRSLPMSV